MNVFLDFDWVRMIIRNDEKLRREFEIAWYTPWRVIAKRHLLIDFPRKSTLVCS